MKKLNKFGFLVLMILFSKFVLADCPSPDSITYDANAHKYYAPGLGGIWYAQSISDKNTNPFFFLGAHGVSSANGKDIVSKIGCAYFNTVASSNILILISPSGTLYNLIMSGGKWTYYTGMGYYCGLDTPTPHNPKDCPFVLN